MIQRDTKAVILETAKSIILTKGYVATGLNEILSAAGVPKGSFYHYFKSKEDFGVELMKNFLSEHEEFLRQHLMNPAMNPYERMVSLFDTILMYHKQKGCQQLCLIAKLGAEVSDLSEAIRKTQSKGIRKWMDIYEQCIREGQATGVMDSNIDPHRAAALIHDLWHGASVRKQIDQNMDPLEDAIVTIKNILSPKK